MKPLQPQKKRTAGRPKENKLLRELKVKTWFNAVAEASGKTAYELEKEFSPSYVDRDKFHKQRSRLWEKYRTGKVMPTMKETKGGRRPIALLVEEIYPGTLQWLTSPIWTLADPDAEITMDYLRSVYESLDPALSSKLLEDVNLKPTVFWRKLSTNFGQLVEEIAQLKTVDGLIALLCLLRESLLCQQENHFKLIMKYFKTLKSSNFLGNHVINLNVIRYIHQNFATIH